MSLSVYVHIPYYLQRCRYCDFTTFEQHTILNPDLYLDHLCREIRSTYHRWSEREIKTLYFGGGTPSLLSPELILKARRELEKVGFRFDPRAEITIEINPATLTPSKLRAYREGGINRFSVGAQTFDDDLLKSCGRKHSSADTRATLDLLTGENYSFDLLFALPGQTLSGLEKDLREVLKLRPPHLSAYCLTVPDSHPMARGRPPELEQVAMFDLIERELKTIGLTRYEISNFAAPGSESRHNQAYWSDEAFWGLGVSAHSYDPGLGPFGTRFWNSTSLPTYLRQTQTDLPQALPEDQFETLKLNEALTDFCHMYLRCRAGLAESRLEQKFGAKVLNLVGQRLKSAARAGWLEFDHGHWRLTPEGLLVSNQVFEALTFLTSDLPTLTSNLSNPYCAV